MGQFLRHLRFIASLNRMFTITKCMLSSFQVKSIQQAFKMERLACAHRVEGLVLLCTEPAVANLTLAFRILHLSHGEFSRVPSRRCESATAGFIRWLYQYLEVRCSRKNENFKAPSL